MVQRKFEARIDWEPDTHGLGQFANHMLVTYDGAIYTLRFYQILPPPLANMEEETLQSIDSIAARHITTLVISSATMPSIIRALEDVVENESKES